jgi:predicted acetyltransferase
MISVPGTELTPRVPAGIIFRRAAGDAAVGVLAACRRRGIAAPIGAHQAGAAHADGIGLVFLEAEPDEERIYRRTGFLDAAAKIWASLR